ncbi:MAG TPA: aquaporin [Candidatus Bathyarchaeia archaeon]|nr:aquaporin [Candidatus Bathyarchaeia archaeon]
MATKKAGSTAKKTTRSKSQPAKTNVTTVKAVNTEGPASASRFGLSDKRTVLAAALIGEFIGTFLLAATYLVTKGEPLYMGFALITLVLMVGTLSGAQLNPAITVGAWVTRKLSHAKAAGYVVAQLLGAGAAYVVLSTYIGAYHVDSANALGQAAPEVYKIAALTNSNHWYVFFAEVLGAAIFSFAFAGVYREKADRVAKALTVGFGLFVAMLVAGVAVSYLSANVVLNPAVAVSATAVDWTKLDWFAVAVYFVAPLVGGVVGFALRDAVEVK